LLEDLSKIRDQAREVVEKRFEEFVLLGRNGTEEDLFAELSFCVLTANWSAQGGIRAQQEIGKNGFLTFSEDELERWLAKVGHRYPKARAAYIVRNRSLVGSLRSILKLDPYVAREWLVKNALGIGYKEASHFLRNVGIDSLAILDRHVLSLMQQYEIIDQVPKTLTRQRYLNYENLLRDLAKTFGESLGKFDLYLWYFIKKKVEK